ncbi:endoglucanase [Salmonella enterica subsp. enterica]|uniref:cellulase n=1 Tax=Salmonella enterica I TaxID=59201 RepID=A0A379W1H0_SALET|nr:endoglucanase [Salmonella enterica subsp. enterica]
MHDGDPQKRVYWARFKPMATLTMKNGVPLEKVDVVSGNAQGRGRSGFPPLYCLSCKIATPAQPCSDSGSQTIFLAVMPITTMCWLSLDKAGISTVFASPSKVNYYLTGGQECVSSR